MVHTTTLRGYIIEVYGEKGWFVSLAPNWKPVTFQQVTTYNFWKNHCKNSSELRNKIDRKQKCHIPHHSCNWPAIDHIFLFAKSYKSQIYLVWFITAVNFLWVWLMRLTKGSLRGVHRRERDLPILCSCSCFNSKFSLVVYIRMWAICKYSKSSGRMTNLLLF